MNFFAAFHMPHKAKSAPATDGAETQFELQILTLHNLAADIADCASAGTLALNVSGDGTSGVLTSSSGVSVQNGGPSESTRTTRWGAAMPPIFRQSPWAPAAP